MDTSDKHLYTSKKLQEEPNFHLQGLVILKEDYARFNKQSNQSQRLAIAPLVEELIHTQQNRSFLIALANYFDLWLHTGQELEKIVAELDSSSDVMYEDEEHSDQEKGLRSKSGSLEERFRSTDKIENSKSAAFVKRILHEAAHPLEAYKRKWRKIHDLLRKRSPVKELKDSMVILGKAYYAIVSWYSEKGLAATLQSQNQKGSNRSMQTSSSNFLSARCFLDPAQALSREQAFWEPYYDTCERAVILHYPELIRLPLNVEMSRLFRSPSFSEYARTKYFRQVALYRNQLRLERSLAAGDLKNPNTSASTEENSSNEKSSSQTKPGDSGANSSSTSSTNSKSSGSESGGQSNSALAASSSQPEAYDMISRFRTDMPSFTPTLSFSDARAISAAAAAMVGLNTSASRFGSGFAGDSSVSTLQTPGAKLATTAAAAAAAAGSSTVVASRSKLPISASSISAIGLHVFLGDVVAPPTELWRSGVGVGGVTSSSAFGSDMKGLAGRRRRITNATAATRSPLISAVLPSRLTRKEQYSSPMASISASNEYARASKLAANVRPGSTHGLRSNSDLLSNESTSTYSLLRQRRKQQAETELRQKNATLEAHVTKLISSMASKWETRERLRGYETKTITEHEDPETFEQLHERTAQLLPPSDEFLKAIEDLTILDNELPTSGGLIS